MGSGYDSHQASKWEDSKMAPKGGGIPYVSVQINSHAYKFIKPFNLQLILTTEINLI